VHAVAQRRAADLVDYYAVDHHAARGGTGAGPLRLEPEVRPTLSERAVARDERQERSSVTRARAARQATTGALGDLEAPEGNTLGAGGAAHGTGRA
jgi:hypothetical protein